MKRVFLSIVFVLIVLDSFSSHCKDSDVSEKFLLINGDKIFLEEVKFDKNGFLEINLNIERRNNDYRLICYSAFLTVEGNNIPIYVDNQIENLRPKILFKFATNRVPKNLYVEFGKYPRSEYNKKWYCFDLESKNYVVIDSCPFKIPSSFAIREVANFINFDIRAFKPANPQPMHYIVYAAPVINPLTGQESTGGRTTNTRYHPVSTQDVFRINGVLKGAGGLILTDDPNLATFVLILNFKYTQTSTFTYSDNTSIRQYHAINQFELYNLISGESIKKEYTTYATYAGEPYSVTLSSKGKQMFAGTERSQYSIGGGGLNAAEFDGYVEFVCKSQTVNPSPPQNSEASNLKESSEGQKIKPEKTKRRKKNQ